MIDFSSVKGITIPEGNVRKIQIGGVTVWSSGLDAPTISVSDSNNNNITVNITLNANNDPVKYRVIEYAPDGTQVYEGSWNSVTSSGNQNFGAYSYTEYVTVEAYSYSDSDVSSTVSQNFTLSRSPYVDAPTVSVTFDGNYTMNIVVGGETEGEIHWSITAEDDAGVTYNLSSGTGSTSTTIDVTTIDPDNQSNSMTVTCSAYAEAYGAYSETVSDSDVWDNTTPDAPTVSISSDDEPNYTVTLNSRNDPVKYRTSEYAPDGTCVWTGSWTTSTTNVSSSMIPYTYTSSVKIEAYSYRNSAVSSTVSDSATLSRTAYIEAPTISLTDDSSGTVSCSISGTGTIYYSFSVYDDDGKYAGGDSGDGFDFSVSIGNYTDNWGRGSAYVEVSAYSAEYGLTSDSSSASTTFSFA